MSNIVVSANILLSDIDMGTTQHEIVKWAIVIKDFTLEISCGSIACGFFVMCLTFCFYLYTILKVGDDM